MAASVGKRAAQRPTASILPSPCRQRKPAEAARTLPIRTIKDNEADKEQGVGGGGGGSSGRRGRGTSNENNGGELLKWPLETEHSFLPFLPLSLKLSVGRSVRLSVFRSDGLNSTQLDWSSLWPESPRVRR